MKCNPTIKVSFFSVQVETWYRNLKPGTTLLAFVSGFKFNQPGTDTLLTDTLLTD